MGTQEAQGEYGIEGRTALVTGGNRNIGRAIALRLAEAGANPVIMYNTGEAEARETLGEINERGAQGAMFQADLQDVDRLRAVVTEVETRFGGVDILVNNAAIRPQTKITDITVDEWDMVFATNLRAPFFLAQAVLPGMVKRGWGRIVNLGGSDAYLSKPLRAHGVSAKMAITGLSRALALEVARFGITVNTLVPGTTDTIRPHPEWYPGVATGFAERKALVPMARLATVRELADACLFLASEMSSFTTGQELLVAGGLPMIRQPLEEYEAEDF